MSPDTSLPRWDLPALYPTTEAFKGSIDGLEHAITELDARVTRFNNLLAITAADVSDLLDDYNQTLAMAIRIDGYANCAALSASPNDAVFQLPIRTASAWIRLESINRLLMVTATRLTGDATDATATLRSHRYWLSHGRTVTAHVMSSDAERLASELAGSGGVRWQQLRDEIVNNLTVETDDGSGESIPLVRLQQRASHPDRTARLEAYQMELRAWEKNSPVIAAAYSAIKSEAATLSRMRGWESSLDQSLSDNHIDRAVLHAMLGAADEVLPDFHRYLRSKATLLGLPQLTWYDLLSPVGGDGVRWTFEDARTQIIDAFSSYSEKAGTFAAHAFTAGWIDAEPRQGKRGGGLCIPMGDGESRLIVNYTPTFAGLRMLAHELGHAWHNQRLHQAGASAVQQVMTPWVLSETAALFFETLVSDAALRRADDAQRLAETETALQFWCRHVVDVLSAFRFESSVFERIENGPLQPDELCRLMRHAQSSVYGDAVDPESFHVYMWAAKPHGFSATSSYNSYPYMFGTFLSLGLFAQYQSDPERFPQALDTFLSSTGTGDVATLLGGLGIDPRSDELWRSCADVIRAEITRFEVLSPVADGGGSR